MRISTNSNANYDHVHELAFFPDAGSFEACRLVKAARQKLAAGIEQRNCILIAIAAIVMEVAIVIVITMAVTVIVKANSNYTRRLSDKRPQKSESTRDRLLHGRHASS